MKYIFGPVASRRLGRSLGVDLIYHKLCTLNCRYCECGATTFLSLVRRDYVPLDHVISELRAILPGLEGDLDYVTFAGSGEPTLSCDIGVVTQAIQSLVKTPTALLTNGTLLHRSDVLDDIRDIDLIIPSLDAADEQTFRAINRPHPDIDFQEYLLGLRNLRDSFSGHIFLEVLLCRGMNDSPHHLEALGLEIRRIRPDAVQLHTAIRPGADQSVTALTAGDLDQAAQRMGIESIRYVNPAVTRRSAIRSVSVDAVLRVVERRPSTLNDLATGTGIRKVVIQKVLDELISTGTVVIREVGGEQFYQRSPS